MGVEGGITYRTTQFGATIAAGASASTIQAAVDACPSGQFVKLGVGNFDLTTRIRLNKDGVTLRGSGAGSTILRKSNLNSEFVYMGEADTWTTATSITSGATKGSSSIVVSSASGLSVGQMVWVTCDDPAGLVFLSNAGGGRHIAQGVLITSIAGTTLGLSAPLVWEFQDNDPELSKLQFNVQSDGVSLEDMTLDCTQGTGTVANAIYMVQCNNSWISGVKVIQPTNRHTIITESIQCTVITNYFDKVNGHAANTSGVEMYRLCSGMRVEDNILDECNIVLDAGGMFSNNVFLNNFIKDPYQNPAEGVYLQYQGLWMNHGPHNVMMLCEGNYTNGVISDGYFGSSSDITVFRNRLHGYAPTGTSDNSMSVALKRWSYDWNIVGNLLGRNGVTLVYKPTTSGYNTGSNEAVLELGYPNSGNHGFTNTVPPASWNNPGSGPGDNQYRDLDVRDIADGGRTLIHGNYDFFNDATTNAAGQETSLPASLFYAAKPAYFGSLPFPLIGPDVSVVDNATTDTNTAVTNPARERYYGRTYDTGGDETDPVVTITGPTSNETTTVATAAFTVSGTATDNVSVSSVTCAMSGATTGSVSISGTATWSGGTTLQAGVTTFTVTATDSSGNTSQDTLVVTYSIAPVQGGAGGIFFLE